MRQGDRVNGKVVRQYFKVLCADKKHTWVEMKSILLKDFNKNILPGIVPQEKMKVKRSYVVYINGMPFVSNSKEYYTHKCIGMGCLAVEV